MELKVWVEGIQRIVCGVSVNTTCQDVVFALAHATGKIGRFTLIERWRNNERLLAPTENPMKILLKWGEYASDVQFILQRSDQIKKEDKSTDLNLKKSNENNDGIDQVPNVRNPDLQLSDQTKEIQKSFCSPDIKCVENIGIVKGVQKLTTMHFPQNESSQILVNNHEKTPSIVSSQSTDDPMQSLYQSKSNEINLADVRNSLDRKINNNNNNNNNNNLNNNNNNNIVNADNQMSISCENLLDALNSNNSSKLSSNSGTPDLYKNAPPISSNGALVPPPYRDPPPPRNSPLQMQMQQQPKMDLSSNKRMEYLDNISTNPFINENEIDSNDNFYQNVQYKDLIQLIKFQREKITFQQSELTKFDAEIIYLESKERDQAQELESISREITKVDQIFRQGSEQLQSLQYVEEENELVKQQEKTLKSEITLLRSKLANCETELLQCKNKIRLIMDDIQIEQRSLTVRQKDNRQNVERDFLNEMERIQTEIDQAIYNTDSTSKNTDNLKKEILLIENAIAEKKRQVEQLVNEMKEVNLQSLAVTPTASSDEIRNLLEGSNRPGSTRRIIGSPRQLENAVPTSKNPHGVWV